MSTRSRLLRIEKALGADRASRRVPEDALLMNLLSTQIIDSYPGIELVEPEDTDPLTYAYIQMHLAQRAHEWVRAAEWIAIIKHLDPLRPCPPGTDPLTHFVAEHNRRSDEIQAETARTKAAIEAAKRRTAAANLAIEPPAPSAC